MKRILLASAACVLLAGCNSSPSSNTPPVVIITPAPSANGLLSMSFVGPLPFFYSPSIIQAADGSFEMWCTNADRVAYYKSVDGRTWTDGRIVFTAIRGSWEDDGNVPESWGYCTGISDPRVVQGVTPGYSHTMYYTAGKAPNTEVSGGIGVAVSNDGINWNRVGSGLMRTFPGGNCFIIQAMEIAGKRHLYYLGGGSATEGPALFVADDVGNGYAFSNDRKVFVGAPGAVMPLFYDEQDGSCWIAVERTDSTPAGPTTFDIYKGSDGFTTLGTKIGTVDPARSGRQANFDPQALQRTQRGTRSGSSPVQIIWASGDAWAAWQPASIIV